MAKRTNPSVRRQRGYEDFELSPGSEYFLYGKGGSDDYAREVRRIKTQLREAIYGEYYDYEKEAEEKNFKVNVSALILIILSVAALVITLIGKIATLESVFHLAEGKDGITLIGNCLDALSDAETSKTGLCIGIFVTAYTVINVLIIIGGAFIVRKRGTGKIIRAITAVAFILCAVTVVTELIDMQTVPVGITIVMVLTFVQAFAAAVGGKKKRR